MNQQAFDAGKAAYQRGDLAEAVAQLSHAKGPGEVSGAIDHLLGNCLMKMGRYLEAANSYGDALRDSTYGHTGALACNRGRALLAAGKPQEAIASLTMAARDEAYATPYKAQLALGSAYKQIGNVREAGVAFRSAAIDESNPDPAFALSELGACFMQMGRAVDAVEAYRTALDFSTPMQDQNAIYADLGLAYVAANRMSEAVDAFTHATSDGSFTLRPEAQAAMDAAKKAMAAISGSTPSETDALLAAAGYGTGAYDPLDPMGKSGEFMPSPEDTGFFSVTEQDLIKQDAHERKARRKHRHTGLKVFVTLLLLVIIIGGGACFAYYRGYGWPTQSSVVEQLLSSGSGSTNFDSLFASSVSDDSKNQMKAILPSSVSGVSIDGVDKSMSLSSVLATATLSSGGKQVYLVELVRDGIGWKVSSLSAQYASQGDTPSSSAQGSTTSGTISGS